MKFDFGRQHDLNDLQEAIEHARSTAEREHYERIAYTILKESAPVRSLREELIRAFRGRDMRRVKQIQEHIHRVKLKESNGVSWGSNVGNRRMA